MPPKRKSTSTTVDETPAKVARATRKTTNKTQPKTKANSKITSHASVEAELKRPFDSTKCLSWFRSYTGLEEDGDFDSDQIGPGGIAKLCEDIGVSLETVDMLVLAYHLEADTMRKMQMQKVSNQKTYLLNVPHMKLPPIFTKDEWIKGMTKLEIDSTEKLRVKMPLLVAQLQDPRHFKEFYRYVFMFAKDSEQKCMPLETACAMLSTVMKGRPHEQRFVAYLETKRPVKVINKDQWYNFLDFSDTISEDLSNYDPIGSAWPVLMDEYVDWRNEQSS
ncbi:DCN1-like protein 5 [Mortierella sp. GBA30]|nr:DCN1-like protein 5 [Mortierella sp. GBA30]